MTAKKAIQEKGTDLRLKLPAPLKRQIRRFRGKRMENDQPITSDAKALLYLAERGLEAEALA